MHAWIYQITYIDILSDFNHFYKVQKKVII